MVTGHGRGFKAGGTGGAHGHSKRGSYDAGTPQDIAKPGYGINANFDAAFAYHFGLSKLVIAAVNGPAAGVGRHWPGFADTCFAVPGIKFTTVMANSTCRRAEYGSGPDAAAYCRISRHRFAINQQGVFSGQAERIGFINQLFPLNADCEPGHARNSIATVALNQLRQDALQVYQDLHGDVASSVDTCRGRRCWMR